MKKILTSNISSTARMPVSDRTLVHLQESYTEVVNWLLRGMVSSNTGLIKLWGCNVSISGQNYTLQEGAAYYNGEIYYVQATSFTAPSGQVGVFSINQSFITGDPVQFKNASGGSAGSFNVHRLDKIIMSAGVSGSGIANHNQMIDIATLVAARHTHAISNVTGLQAALDDLDINKAEILTISYTAITNPAANTSGSVTYFLDSLGFVHLSGSVTVSDTGVADSNLLIGTLPTGVRPPATTQYVWFLDTQISIANSGEIRVQRLASDTVVYNFRTIAPFPGT